MGVPRHTHGPTDIIGGTGVGGLAAHAALTTSAHGGLVASTRAAFSLIGNNTASPAGAVDLSVTDVRTMLGLGTADSPMFTGLNLSALQTIDLGSGSTGITLGTWMRAFGADTANLQLALASYGNGNGPTLYAYNVGGTRSSPSATPNGVGIFTIIGRGHDGTSLTGSKTAFGTLTDGLWTGSNNGTYWQMGLTPNGSTTFAYGLRYQSHILTLDGGGGGMSPTVGNGLVQLASGTTKANGIALGPDTFIYRSGAGLVRTDGSFGVGVSPVVALHAQGTTSEAQRTLRLAYDGTYYGDIAQRGAAGVIFRTFGSNKFVWEASGVVSATLEGTALSVVGNVGFNGVTAIAKPAITGSRGGNAALASVLTALANYGLITDSSTA